jgi:heptosyltransferase I
MRAADPHWLIGRLEHKLLGHVPDVEFVVFDKNTGARAYRELRARLAGRRFDALLHMQLALRASLAAACVPAGVRLGFDRARARELQWLFSNARIEPKTREHVQEVFRLSPPRRIAVRSMRWDIPPTRSLGYAQRTLPSGEPTLIVSPTRVKAPQLAAGDTPCRPCGRPHGMWVLICGGERPRAATGPDRSS